MPAFLDGYAGLEIPCPNGITLHAKVLPLDKAMYFVRLSDKLARYDEAGKEIPAEDPEARFKIIEEFPKAVELTNGTPPDFWNSLTIPEFWVVFWSFFVPRAKRETPSPTPEPNLSTGIAS